MGVLLDCERGQVSFLREGHEFYLQHPAAVNMGVAFLHVRSEGSSHESGLRTSTLYYPVFGLSKKDDKISLRGGKWLSLPGEPADLSLTQLLQTPSLLQRYANSLTETGAKNTRPRLPIAHPHAHICKVSLHMHVCAYQNTYTHTHTHVGMPMT